MEKGGGGGFKKEEEEEEEVRKRSCGVYECLLFELYIFDQDAGSNGVDGEYSVT